MGIWNRKYDARALAKPWIAKVLKGGVMAILVIAPFYAFLVVVLASHLKHLDLFKIWKEIALASLFVLLVGFVVTHWQSSRLYIKNKLIILSVLYGLLILVVASYDLLTARVSRPAVIYGLLVDGRLIGFFVLVLSISLVKQFHTKVPWRRIIIIPAILVVSFGLLQMTILPKDFLGHFGYNAQTIAPYKTIDNQPNLVRVQSSLRGPNPLGAYLLVISSILVALIIKEPHNPYRKRFMLLLLASLIVLFGTYSRAAWAGAFISLVIILALSFKPPPRKSSLVLPGAVIAITILVGTVLLFRNTYLFQNVFFHTSNRSTSSVSSNAQRASAFKNGLHDIINHPFGTGVGSAGPASLRNTKHPARLAENYYLQIGQEIGVIGLVLFIAIQFLVVVHLYNTRNRVLALSLLASFVGLIIVNMTSHAWTDDTLAYVWWGLAGIAVAPAILNEKRKHHV